MDPENNVKELQKVAIRFGARVSLYQTSHSSCINGKIHNYVIFIIFCFLVHDGTLDYHFKETTIKNVTIDWFTQCILKNEILSPESYKYTGTLFDPDPEA